MTTDELALEPVVDPSGWFSVQLRYSYLIDGGPMGTAGSGASLANHARSD